MANNDDHAPRRATPEERRLIRELSLQDGRSEAEINSLLGYGPMASRWDLAVPILERLRLRVGLDDEALLTVLPAHHVADAVGEEYGIASETARYVVKDLRMLGFITLIEPGKGRYLLTERGLRAGASTIACEIRSLHQSEVAPDVKMVDDWTGRRDAADA